MRAIRMLGFICDWQRQFSDDQIKAVIERGGVLGVALDIIMMQNGYVRGLSKNEATLEGLSIRSVMFGI